MADDVRRVTRSADNFTLRRRCLLSWPLLLFAVVVVDVVIIVCCFDCRCVPLSLLSLLAVVVVVVSGGRAPQTPSSKLLNTLVISPIILFNPRFHCRFPFDVALLRCQGQLVPPSLRQLPPSRSLLMTLSMAVLNWHDTKEFGAGRGEGAAIEVEARHEINKEFGGVGKGFASNGIEMK